MKFLIKFGCNFIKKMKNYFQQKVLYKIQRYIKRHLFINCQKKAKEIIIQKVDEALSSEKTEQLIFIDGEAGTGKTVLNSSTFYELYCQAEKAKKDKNELRKGKKRLKRGKCSIDMGEKNKNGRERQ